MSEEHRRDAKFSHLTGEGAAHMVDVGEKKSQLRIAKAQAVVRCAAATIDALRERALPKGDVLTVAQVAGIQSAKQTANLIPMCHPLPLDFVGIDFVIEPEAIRITAEVRTSARTGVEMEALTAATIAALTIYDMCKAVDHGMVISEIRLLEKRKL
ncbi:MAG TPA: cyclic pyranopterin monophosphate synthase MoaC [Chthoniobacteraceae bacterium]|nr:cyclic pyranopterin monophosphate synthase MoaC [Chthoniobacteraceae bacterium]